MCNARVQVAAAGRRTFPKLRRPTAPDAVREGKKDLRKRSYF